MSDNSFMEKLDMTGGFKESALKLNSYVVKASGWNEDSIKERAMLLADIAKRVWKYPKISDEELSKYKKKDDETDKYSIDSYDINTFNKRLLDEIDVRIKELSPKVKREFKKLYIAYKLKTNFADIVIQKKRLRISLNMKFSQIDDPKKQCRDITDKKYWGNGDVEVYMEDTSEIDYIMYLIKQAYDLQNK